MFYQNLTIKSYAKINLGLFVISKREDNYHSIETIMQSVDLFDLITIKETRYKTKVICFHPLVPNGKKNLVYKTLELMKEKYNIKKNFEIEIKKNIPPASGLGGASSNAANIILAINKMLNLNLRYQELLKLAEKLGGDVPFFIKGGTSLVESKGEKIKKLPLLFFWAVIVKPDFSISTSWAYNNLEEYSKKGKIKNILNIIRTGRIDNLSVLLENDLEKVVIKKYPEIEEIKEKLIKEGAIASSLSGSGSAVFGIVKNKYTGEKIKNMFKKIYKEVFLVKTTNSGGEEL